MPLNTPCPWKKRINFHLIFRRWLNRLMQNALKKMRWIDRIQYGDQMQLLWPMTRKNWTVTRATNRDHFPHDAVAMDSNNNIIFVTLVFYSFRLSFNQFSCESTNQKQFLYFCVRLFLFWIIVRSHFHSNSIVVSQKYTERTSERMKNWFIHTYTHHN